MKYLGGKQRLGKHLAPFLKKLIAKMSQCNGYIEPFCGSCGVLKNMTNDLSLKKIIANDYHPDLIQMWKEVKAGTFVYPESISEEEYFAAKALPSPNGYKSFVGFGMSFGGRYFGAYAHKYINAKKEDFCKEMVHSLHRTAPLIKDVEFTNILYQDCVNEETTDMFIYCDPPYAYTKYPIKYRRDVKHYDTFDTAAFWETVRKWSKNNVVVVSEIVAPPDFKEIWNMDRYRSACQSAKTGKKNVAEDDDFIKSEKLFIWSESNFVF